MWKPKYFKLDLSWDYQTLSKNISLKHSCTLKRKKDYKNDNLLIRYVLDLGTVILAVSSDKIKSLHSLSASTAEATQSRNRKTGSNMDWKYFWRTYTNFQTQV